MQVSFSLMNTTYGDVPCLGGNTNIAIEQVAGVIYPAGFHIIAGLEGGYVAEQLAPRSGALVHKVELLQFADEKYPIQAERSLSGQLAVLLVCFFDRSEPFQDTAQPTMKSVRDGSRLVPPLRLQPRS